MTRDIDLVPRKSTPFRKLEFERRGRVELAGVPLWMVRAEDLILSKLDWLREAGSEQQRRDIEALLAVPPDRAYLAHWAEELGLGKLLAKIENE